MCLCIYVSMYISFNIHIIFNNECACYYISAIHLLLCVLNSYKFEFSHFFCGREYFWRTYHCYGQQPTIFLSTYCLKGGYKAEERMGDACNFDENQ